MLRFLTFFGVRLKRCINYTIRYLLCQSGQSKNVQKKLPSYVYFLRKKQINILTNARERDTIYIDIDRGAGLISSAADGNFSGSAAQKAIPPRNMRSEAYISGCAFNRRTTVIGFA